jgi:NADPH-dependent 2,4-dienoyl-CoA reductase/sulfur reductase-like enzyme
VRIVVVGASLAGVRTIQALRRHGCDAQVTLIGREPGIACDRPPLSKGFLSDPDAAARPLLGPEDLAKLEVTMILGRSATDLAPAEQTVGTDSGERIGYDTLVIATGSSPRLLPGLEPRPGVQVLRTGADAARIRDALSARARVVVVGGGFIGAEIASTGRRMGCAVTVIEPLPALMIRGLGPALSQAMTRRHVLAGTDLRLGVGVAGLESGAPHPVGAAREPGAASGGQAVRLTDGAAVPADLVVVAAGAVPETGWLRGSGLDLSDGVLCDGLLSAAGVPGVYAAGDVARWRHPRYADPVRMEHWTSAIEQAAVVAANICGQGRTHDALPYVWSDQLGGRLQIFGRVQPNDDVHYVLGDASSDAFVAITGGDGRLNAVVGFGAVRELLPYRKLLLGGAPLSAALGLAGTSA